jgi:hypothetical protein
MEKRSSWFAMTSRDPCPECGTHSYPTPEEAYAETLRLWEEGARHDGTVRAAAAYAARFGVTPSNFPLFLASGHAVARAVMNKVIEARSAEASRAERLEREIAELRDAVADADRKWAEARIEATRVKMDAYRLTAAYERACRRLVELGEHPPTYDDSEEEA